MYKLIIEDDEGKKTVVPLIRDEITIGRKEGNTIRLTERNVSRKHAKLLRNNGAVFIEDLESYNGIKVNGAKIDGRVAVAEGDRIQIGDYVLGLQAEGEQLSPASTPAVTSRAETIELPLVGPTAPTEPATDEPKPAAPHAPAAAPTTATEGRGEAARLVCVSSNFAGLEAVLDKPVVVVGRTADNDIVINHRSISRHHAQIVEENGRYTIMDMQSVNGVRVNGEEYGKVELRRGDLIDLGHVRLRFIAPGERFNFATDATIFDMAQVEPSRSVLWLVLALVALLAVGVVLWRVVLTPSSMRGQSSSGDLAVNTNEVLAEEITAVGEEDDHELTRRILDANSAYEWKQALELCEQLSAGGKKAAEKDCQAATVELENKGWFDRAVAAELRNEHKDALVWFRKIPETSVYYAQLQKSDVFRQAARNYEAESLRAVDEAVEQLDCDLVEKLADELENLVPDSKGAEGKVESCKAEREKRGAARRSASKATKQRRSSTTTTTADEDAEPKAAPAGPSAEEIAEAKKTLDQAWKAYREGYYTLASSLARKVLRSMPNQQALSIVGASACYLKRPKQAQEAYDRLDSQRRQLLRRVCQRMGVPIN